MNEEAKNFAQNLKLLMDHHKDTQETLAVRSGVNQKTISNMLNPGDDKSPNLKKIARVANAYKLKTWHILYPNATLDVLINTSMEKFVENYADAEPEEREAWAKVAETSVKIKKKLKAKGG